MAPAAGAASTRAEGADHVTLRRHNLSVVLHHLRTVGSNSRARIAAVTGLNKATVSSLVAELIERGLVHETESERGAVGRPSQLVELDGRRVVGIGAEVNVDYIAILVRGLDGHTLLERRLPLDVAKLAPKAALGQLAALIQEGARDAAEADGNGALHIAGLTLAVPGLVQVEPGVVALAPNLGWSDVPVVELMREALGGAPYAIRVDNEANLAAIAAHSEVLANPAPGMTDMHDIVLLTGAIGVGGGMVSGGRLLRGGHGFSGEVGHMPIGPADRTCGCGRKGCWETVVGLGALLELAAAPDDDVRDPDLDVDARLAELTRRATSGDVRTLEALEQVGRGLGIGAAVLVNILNPDALILGGYFAAMEPWLTPHVERELASRVIAPNAGGCRVLVSRLGFTAAVRGGAQISLEAVFADPTVVDVGSDHVGLGARAEQVDATAVVSGSTPATRGGFS